MTEKSAIIAHLGTVEKANFLRVLTYTYAGAFMASSSVLDSPPKQLFAGLAVGVVTAFGLVQASYRS